MSAGYGAAVGFAAGALVNTVAVFAHAAERPLAGLAGVAVAVVVVSANTTIVGALLTAAQCWALYDGFLLGRTGMMVFDAAAGRAAAVLVVFAALASGLSWCWHAWQLHRLTVRLLHLNR